MEEETDKTARYFAASKVSAYRLSTSKITFSYINNHDLPGFAKTQAETTKTLARNRESSM
jgi:hypothetical protein